MRIQVSPRRVDLVDGVPFEISVTVTNTTDVIGGYRIRLLGADPNWVELPEDRLSLFPDASGTVTATITIPRDLPAGDRRIAVQVKELTPPGGISVSEIELVVPPVQAIGMALTPMTVICGQTGRFGVSLENSGNTVVTAVPIGVDPEEKVRFAFDPPVVALAPGEHAITDLRTTAYRRWFGSPVVRNFTLGIRPDQVVHRPDEPPTAPVPPEPVPPLATGSMVQKPRLSRGVISLLSLLVAVSVFAVVITIALAKLVSVSAADRDLAIQVAAAQQSAADQGSSTLGGQVQLLSGGSEASGVAVEIFSATALGSPLTSTATDAAGNWKVPNLPAGAYKLRFRGAGFAEVWYPQALTSTDAKPVDVQVGQKATNLNVTLGGLPATISGSVVGDNVAGAVLTLSVPVSELPRDGAPPTASSAAPTSTRPTQVQTGAPVSTPAPGRAPALGAPVPAAAAPTPAQSSAAGAAAATVALQPGAIVKSVPIGSDGSFTLDNVISPAVYELTVSKAGYATASQKVDLDGGEDREGVDLRLRTGDGLISGTIIGPAGPVGGAVVTATTGTTSMKTVSLTRGAIGTFILRGLVTPGSYTVTVVAKGFGTQSSTLSLTAGQKLTGVRFTLARSAGAISGTVTTLPDNKPAPNVTVAVTGGSTDLKTVTQSATAVGSWKIDGLAIPGSYTVTFSREGLESQTVAVALGPTGSVNGAPAGQGIAVTMKPSAATISGTVTQQGRRVGEASVTLSSGTTTYAVTSASQPSSQLGHYEITDVAPGTYTLSTNLPGTSPTTVIVTVTAGQLLTYDPVLIQAASISGTVTVAGGGTRVGLQVLLYQSANYPTQVYLTTTTDETGSYSFASVNAPQAYVLEVRSPTSGPLGSKSFVLDASTAAVVDLTVGAAATPTTGAGTAVPSAGPPVPIRTTTTPTVPASTPRSSTAAGGTAPPPSPAATGAAVTATGPATTTATSSCDPSGGSCP